MSKNTKRETYKEYLALQRRDNKLYEEKKNLGYRELEKPIHHGYTAYVELREDVAKRTDKVGLAYQYIVKHFSTECWGRTLDFWEKKKKQSWYDYEYYYKPKIRKITEREFEALPPNIAKYFYNYKVDNKMYWGTQECKIFSHVIPEHYLVIKIKKSYLTHQKIVDSELEREISFVEDKLSEFYDKTPYFRHSGIGKRTKQLLNRRDRGYNKQVLRKNLKTMFISDSLEYLNYQSEIHRLENEVESEEYKIDESHFKPLTEKEFYEESDWTEWTCSWDNEPYEFKHKHRHGGRWYYW